MENKHIIYILFSIIIILILILIFKKYFNYTLNIDFKINKDENFESYITRKQKKEHFEDNKDDKDNKEEIIKEVKEMIKDNNTNIIKEIKNIKCECKKEKFNNEEGIDNIIKEQKGRKKIHSDVMINAPLGKNINRKNKLLIDSLIFDENIPEAYYHYYYKPESNKNDIKIGYNYNEYITKQKPYDMSNEDLSNSIIDKKDEIEGSNEMDIYDEE